MNLKTLNAELATVRAEQSKASAQLGDIAAEEFDLKSSTSTKAAKVAAAEEHLIDQLYRRDLGEPCDVPAAEKALAEAKARPDDGFAAAARLRTLATFRQRAEAEHQACHERGLSIMAAISAAEAEAITVMGADLLSDTEAAMATVARNACLLAACRSLAAERGASWPHAVLREAEITLKNQISPNAARAEVLAALAA